MSVLYYVKNLLHSLGLVYKSMRGMMTNSIYRDQWLNVTSESRDRIQPFFFFFSFFFNFALGRNRTRDPRVPEPKRTPLGYILYYYLFVKIKNTIRNIIKRKTLTRYFYRRLC
jgi:hypothetical protein